MYVEWHVCTLYDSKKVAVNHLRDVKLHQKYVAESIRDCTLYATPSRASHMHVMCDMAHTRRFWHKNISNIKSHKFLGTFSFFISSRLAQLRSFAVLLRFRFLFSVMGEGVMGRGGVGKWFRFGAKANGWNLIRIVNAEMQVQNDHSYDIFSMFYKFYNSEMGGKDANLDPFPLAFEVYTFTSCRSISIWQQQYMD